MNTLQNHILLALLCLSLIACGGDNLPDLNTDNQGANTQSGDHVVVSAHRGGAAYAPENTMLAMDNAIRLGVDQLETDSQLTADGVLVLIHDDTVDRTTNCTGAVIDMTYAELQQCDAAYWFSPGQRTTSPDENRDHPLRGQGITIPTAEELFARLAAMGDAAPELSIEIKDIPGESNFDPVGVNVATVLVPLIQQYGLQSKTIVQAFWPTAANVVKAMDPTIRTQFLSTSEIGIVATLGLTYTIAGNHDIAAPNFDAPDMSAEYVQLAQGAGKQVYPWTVDQAEDMVSISELGVDGIITNFPACLLALQGRRASGVATPAGVTQTPDCPD